MRHGLSDRRQKAERKLFDVHARLERARSELDVVEAQLTSLLEMADEARVRMLVSETPLAEREWREAKGHAVALERSRDRARAEVAALERAQDDLFSELVL